MPSLQTADREDTGLRHRQKIRRRARIIAAGKKLFFGQGYSATSMEAIADLAEVGVATVYNYFGSKGQLLADIHKPEFDGLFAQAETLLAHPPTDPITGILSLIDIYRHFQNDWDKKDALMAVIGPGLSAEPILDDFAENTENQVKQQIKCLINIYQEKGLVRQSIDITDASIIIFYIFNQHFIEYITHEDADYKKMVQSMDRQISFIVTAIQF